ncbi:hypothetical protein HanPSC8_Chr06g0233991 [Helianthus annuus]|nr:hypothetical protein HanPSC8_Chr06g0233991 [Helianthus annuus]
MPFSSPEVWPVLHFHPNVCFFASGSKRFEILPFSSRLVNSSDFSSLSQGYFIFFVNLKGNSVFFTLRKKKTNTP